MWYFPKNTLYRTWQVVGMTRSWEKQLGVKKYVWLEPFKKSFLVKILFQVPFLSFPCDACTYLLGFLSELHQSWWLLSKHNWLSVRSNIPPTTQNTAQIQAHLSSWTHIPLGFISLAIFKSLMPSRWGYLDFLIKTLSSQLFIPCSPGWFYLKRNWGKALGRPSGCWGAPTSWHCLLPWVWYCQDGNGKSFFLCFHKKTAQEKKEKKKKKMKEEKKLSFPCCNIFVSGFFYIPRKKEGKKKEKKWLHPIIKVSYSQDQGKRGKPAQDK